MKPKFKVGDKVTINFNLLDEDTDLAGVSTNSRMRHLCGTSRVLTVMEYRCVNDYPCYRLDDRCIYNEAWLIPLQPEVIYHSNPKIQAVIIKIKEMESKRKELGYVF